MGESLLSFLMAIPLGIALLLMATLVFDVFHVILHRWADASNPLLRRIGGLHGIHHRFLDSELHIHTEFIQANIWCHVIPEFIVQVIVTCLLGVLFPLTAVMIALGLELMVFVLIMKPTPGFDINHHHVDQLKAYRPLYFCVPEYHLLHHVYPRSCFSSWIKTLDHLLATGVDLHKRRIAMTGVETVFGRYLSERLADERSQVTAISALALNDQEWLEKVFKNSSILVLCHASRSTTDYQDLIEQYRQKHSEDRIPVEVWALSTHDGHSSLEIRAYEKFARKLFTGEKVIYRHMVIFGGSMDIKSMEAIVRGIRRGFNYVPSRFGWMTLKHYLQFVLK